MAEVVSPPPSKNIFKSIFKSKPKAPKEVKEERPEKKPKKIKPEPAVAPAPDEFSGESLEECQKFARAVWVTAFHRGKQEDNLWKARYAASCLKGPALLWYEELDDATRNDWESLRAALYALFPGAARDQSNSISTPAAPPPQSLATLLSPTSSIGTERLPKDSLQSPIIPRPALVPTANARSPLKGARSSASIQTSSRPTSLSDPNAPPILPAFTPVPALSDLPSLPPYIKKPDGAPAAAGLNANGELNFNARGGYLCLDYEDSATLAVSTLYVSSSSSESGMFQTTSNKSDALRVWFDPLIDPHRLRPLNNMDGHNWLGLRWNSKDPMLRGLASIFGMNSLNDDDKQISTDATVFDGPKSMDMWDIYPDGTVGVYGIENDNGRRILQRLEVAISASDSDKCNVFLVKDFDKFDAVNSQTEEEDSESKHQYRLAHFMFEVDNTSIF